MAQILILIQILIEIVVLILILILIQLRNVASIATGRCICIRGTTIGWGCVVATCAGIGVVGVGIHINIGIISQIAATVIVIGIGIAIIKIVIGREGIAITVVGVLDSLHGLCNVAAVVVVAAGAVGWRYCQQLTIPRNFNAVSVFLLLCLPLFGIVLFHVFLLDFLHVFELILVVFVDAAFTAV